MTSPRERKCHAPFISAFRSFFTVDPRCPVNTLSWGRLPPFSPCPIEIVMHGRYLRSTAVEKLLQRKMKQQESIAQPMYTWPASLIPRITATLSQWGLGTRLIHNGRCPAAIGRAYFFFYSARSTVAS